MSYAVSAVQHPMPPVLLTVADQFAAAFYKHKISDVQWLKNATECVMPQGGLVGFISVDTLTTFPFFGKVSKSFYDVEWTRSGQTLYCVGVLCADGDYGGAAAEPVALFSCSVDDCDNDRLLRWVDAEI